MKRFLTSVMTVLVCFTFAACDNGSDVDVEKTDDAAETQPAPVTAEDVKQKFGEAARVTGEYLSSKSATWSAEAREKLADMKSSVNEWRDNNAGPKFDAWRDEMHRLADAAEEKLEALQGAGAEKWEDLKQAADEAAAKAREHWEEGKKQFSPPEVTPDDSPSDATPPAEAE